MPCNCFIHDIFKLRKNDFPRDFYFPTFFVFQARFLADREWIPILNDAHKHYGSGKSEVVAKVWYLSCVMQYPLYGCTMFPANYRGYWSYGNTIIIAVHCEGILLVKPDDKYILFEFPYTEIESLLLDPSDNFITMNLVKTAQERQRVYVFETGQKASIGALVAAYRYIFLHAFKIEFGHKKMCPAHQN